MADEPYRIKYPKTADCSLSTIEELVESGIQQGWETSHDGETNGLLYNGPLNDYTSQRHPKKNVLQDLSEHRRGSITFWVDNIDFSLSLYATWERFNDLSGFSFCVDPVHYRQDAEDVTNTIIQIATTIYNVLDQPVAFSSISIDDTSHVHQLLEGQLTDVYWLLLLPPTLVERLDQSIIETDLFWFNERLPDGGHILVATANPLSFTPSLKEELRAKLALSK
ncbi:hypothetical protein ACFQJ7_08740 [Halovenus rubra]|uniref:Uncharacterized protein n=2 Tax=Halovenus rubra TaxID=869890 RepID=A0ABD5X4K3_9EURY|nr:hypothetical protein [Halovenus rubra]